MAMKFILPVALLPVVLAIACNRAPREAKAENFKILDRGLHQVDMSAAADSTAVAFGNAGEQSGQQAGAPKQQVVATGAGQTQLSPNPDWDKKIVKTANLSIEVPHFSAYTDRLHQQVRAAGGYITLIWWRKRPRNYAKTGTAAS